MIEANDFLLVLGEKKKTFQTSDNSENSFSIKTGSNRVEKKHVCPLFGFGTK
jgi:hypothetical protein